jgi:hypothetical protein
MQKIEEALTKAHSIPSIWSKVLSAGNVKPGSKSDRNLQDLLIRASQNEKKRKKFNDALEGMLDKDLAAKILTGLIPKLLEMLVRGQLGH